MGKRILLVHGACHGAWCWDKLLGPLSSLGHSVETIDLPGRAGRGSPGWGQTLNAYAQSVVEALGSKSERAVVVGHSMGGFVISAAAERAPELFERLVYLSAFLPSSGDSMASLGKQDKHSDLSKGTRVSLFRGLVSIGPPQNAANVFYGDCTPEQLAWTQQRLIGESLRPSITKISLSSARFGAIPRSYIRCTLDRALSIQLQDLMIAKQPCDRVVTLEASHSPFLSMPDQLAKAIGSVI
jgi:pimeloyl-ACP methyl ester carboxylesterase